jgi:insulysin
MINHCLKALCLGALTLPLQSESAAYEIIENKNSLKILTPSLKERKELKVRLENGLEALIISDPDANTSAAGIAIEAGSFDDPEEYPGMAHFCEHMLFMGSKKYPDENGFWKKISNSGGTANAYTKEDRTVYMFSSNHDSFKEILDIYAQFFIEPLFKENAVKRELLAVNQEYEKNIDSDAWRAHMVLKMTSRADHPFCKFSTGSSETLGKIELSTLRTWFRKNYSAHKMHLVIYSNQDLETSLKMVLNSFSPIPMILSAPREVPTKLLSEGQKGHIFYIEPLQESRNLRMIWQMPADIANDLNSKVPDLIAYALAYKGENSLYETLRKEGLAEDLSSDAHLFAKDTMLLTLEVQLTKKGVQAVSHIIKETFKTIHALKARGIPPHLFHESRRMQEINYAWQSRSNSFSYVTDLADSMVDEPLDTFPQKVITLSRFQPNAIQTALSSMTAESAVFFVIAPPALTKQEPTQREEWLGALYSTTKIEEDRLQEWNSLKPNASAHTIAPNKFIPEKLNLLTKVKESEEFEPSLLSDEAMGRCYFLKDRFYLVPEVAITMSVRSPLINNKPQNIALLDLYTLHLMNKLSPQISCAKRGGLHVSFSQEKLRFVIQVGGFDEKADVFMATIFESMKKEAPSKAEFMQYKDELLNLYDSQEKSLAFIQARAILQSVLFNDSQTGKDLYEALTAIRYEDLISYQEKFLQTAYLEGMIGGNLDEVRAKNIWKEMKESLQYTSYPVAEHPEQKVLALPDGKGPFILTEVNPLKGNAALLTLQLGGTTYPKIASASVLGKALSEAFFTELRTKQQTAYIAKSWLVEKCQSLHLFFGAHSTSHNAAELLNRFELFLEDFERNIAIHVPRERFEAIQQSLITTYSQPASNLQEKVSELNSYAFIHNKEFRRKAKIKGALETLSYDDFLAASEPLTRTNPKRIAILVTGSNNSAPTYILTSPLELKNLCPF